VMSQREWVDKGWEEREEVDSTSAFFLCSKIPCYCVFVFFGVCI